LLVGLETGIYLSGGAVKDLKLICYLQLNKDAEKTSI
jgi:hypothetical protein